MLTSLGTRSVASDSTSPTSDRSPEEAVPVEVAPTPPAVIRRVRHATPDVDQSIARFQEDGDCDALDTVMAAYDWLALSCARRLQRRDESIEDLEQVAREGLLGAVARFDVDRGIQFKSFAWASVLGALRHYYRDRWQMRVPRGLQEMHLASVRAIEEATALLGRSPTIDELSERMGMHREDVVLALEAGHAYRVDSLDRAPDDDRDHVSLERVLAYVDEPLEHVAERVDLREMLATLPLMQRTILVMGYFDGKTQSEIGVCLGISQVHVSRLTRTALADLRKLAAA